ncbi:MAG: ABC transporter substrate-binding protein [Clostridia bacterium]|nr:ABC transporter substrate-binding protein [Clostridia bacterium]
MKKVVSLALALCMVVASVFAFASCGKKTSYTVGICQLVEHPALDAATKGFKDALVKALGEENVTFNEANAQGDSNTCATIVNDFVNKHVDLIMANATPALQAAANATTTIPILGTSVTDYATALSLKDFNGTVGGNISGTSDLAPLDKQAEMIKELYPDCKKVGLLYCSAEANSLFQVNAVAEALTKLGIESVKFSFADSNDIAAVAAAAAAGSDVVYIPTDNTAANCTEAVYGAIYGAGLKTPVVAGEEGICKGCGLATLSIDYYDLGYATGEMAAKILKGEAKIGETAIAYAPQVQKKYNKAVAELLGKTMPEGYTAID